ncbi:MAG TPA: hypothetical protein VEW74_04885 [Candidatus Nitrosotalea sp.]|nr:hypothetical protein [Candidatus Nitrosotalea sp.]
MLKASKAEIDRLFERYGIAPIAIAGSDSRNAARRGWLAEISIGRSEGFERLSLSIGKASVEETPPQSIADARAIVAGLRARGVVPDDASFEHMLADLLAKLTKMFDECEAEELTLTSVRLHPTSYHIGGALLRLKKPLRTKARLEPDSHDRGAVFAHRHGDSTRFPR